MLGASDERHKDAIISQAVQLSLSPPIAAAYSSGLHPPNIGFASDGLKPDNMSSATSIGTVKSSIISADSVATFLQKNQDKIRPPLDKGLSELGYFGEYLLLAGFNDELLRKDKEDAQVFLVLDGDLRGGDTVSVMSISQIIAPIFSPYATVMHTTSVVYNLLAPTELVSTVEIQNLSQSPRSDEQLQEFSHRGEGGNNGGTEVGGAGEGVKNIDECSEDGEGDKGEDDNQEQLDKGKASEKCDQTIPEHYGRKLSLNFDMPLSLTPTCGRAQGDVHFFRLHWGVKIELKDNKNGAEWLDLMEEDKEDKRIASDFPPGDPLCSVRFSFISITQSRTVAHYPSAVTAHVAATPYHTRCVQRFPPVGYFAASDIELSHETADRVELSKPLWSINHMEMPMGDARVVEIDYVLNNASQAGDSPGKEIKPGPSILFSQPLVRGTQRTLRIFTRILWKLPGTEEIGPKSGNLTQIFRKIAGRPQPLVYANFLQKNSIEINVEKVIQEGRDDIELTGGTPIGFNGDSLQDDGKTRGTMFQALPIQIMQNGEECPIQVPIRRAVITPIEGNSIARHRLQEGEELVTSPDPDPFKLHNIEG